jgi:hypothetical protein
MAQVFFSDEHSAEERDFYRKQSETEISLKLASA